MIQEQWRPVVGYEGLYEVSNFGSVRSLDRTVTNRCMWGTLRTYVFKGKLLTCTPLSSGHRMVKLYKLNGGKKKGGSKGYAVHRLVLEAFIGPCPDNMECCHYDDDPSNNHLSNLRWDTRRANYQDRIRLNHANDVTVERGEQRYNAKVTEDIVRMIRRERARGVPLRILSERVGVNQARISAIANRRAWQHVK